MRAVFNLLAIKIATQIIFSFAGKGERVQRKNKQKVEGLAEGIGKIFRRMVRGKNRTDNSRGRKMEEKLRRKRKREAREALKKDQGQMMM